MKNQINKPTLNISVFGTKLKVIRVGKSPRLIDSEKANIKANHIHSHFTYEAFFITDDSLGIVTSGKRTTYERGVVIIPPHIDHYTLPKGNGCFCLLFSIEGETKIRDRLGDSIYKIPMSDDIDYCIKALSRKSDEGTASSEKAAELFAALIFNELICAIDPTMGKKSPSINESKHIGAIETYINNNLQKKITLSDVASQVYLSNRQVARILQKEYGCTLSQLVIEKKLALAKMLLKDTDMKIGEIASSVNLGAENYFYLIFKKKFGVSPLRYRKQIKN